MTQRDWAEWHRDYDDPGSLPSRRLELVVARAAGGEVLVTRPVVDMAAGVDGLEFHRIGEVGLKGFSEPTELFIASGSSG